MISEVVRSGNPALCSHPGKRLLSSLRQDLFFFGDQRFQQFLICFQFKQLLDGISVKNTHQPRENVKVVTIRVATDQEEDPRKFSLRSTERHTFGQPGNTY
jgi:hypothetical protein